MQDTNNQKLLNQGSFYDFGNANENLLFWEVDLNQTITYVNSVLYRYLGVNKDEIIGQKLADVLVPDDLEAWNEIIKLNTDTYNNMGFKIKSNSSFVHVNTSGAVIKKDGVVVGFYGVATIESANAITKQVIKKLRITNKTILSTLDDALVIVDKNERFTAVSPSFFHLWDIKKEVFFQSTMGEVLAIMKASLSDTYFRTSLAFTQNFDNLTKTKDVLKFKDGRIIERTSSPHIFEGGIVGKCWMFKDISKQSFLVEKLSSLAFRDSLTKLYNRRWCEKKLKQLLVGKKSKSMAFFYMDLDHFKVINDSCGHLHGDDALEQVSEILLDTIGKKALLSRLGGDEFGLILLNKSRSEVVEIAGKIKHSLSCYTFNWKKKIFKISISIGIVFIESEDDFRSVFIHADEACYQSKTNGKNQYTIYNAKQIEFQKTKTELKWYDAIQKALLNGKFELWCQPINDINLPTPHYEILLRMRTEDNKVVSPGLFMASADRFGMIYTIDKLVVDSFCKFYRENYNTVQSTLFSINLSGHTLSRNNFLPFVLSCLEKYNVDYSDVCFEITESEIIKNLDKALVFIKAVRSLGCKISLDDFGKGLTSFSYLKDIPYDYIKIDGQFIKELNDNKINSAIIKSIVYIAEVMGKKTIAEHIEDEKTLNQVAELGVNYFQGYYFSEPHKITKLLE